MRESAFASEIVETGLLINGKPMEDSEAESDEARESDENKDVDESAEAGNPAT